MALVSGPEDGFEGLGIKKAAPGPEAAYRANGSVLKSIGAPRRNQSYHGAGRRFVRSITFGAG